MDLVPIVSLRIRLRFRFTSTSSAFLISFSVRVPFRLASFSEPFIQAKLWQRAQKSSSALGSLGLTWVAEMIEPPTVFTFLSWGYYDFNESPWPKKLGNEKIQSAYFNIIVLSQRKPGEELKQGRKQEAETYIDARAECCFLFCSWWLAQPEFL